jgi:hypothetical protein
VAIVQIFLVQGSDLNRWKGGGFGMYSDPHSFQRFVWVRGLGEGEERAIRVFPLDKRLRFTEPDDSRLRDALNRLSFAAQGFRYFPSGTRCERLTTALREFETGFAQDPRLAKLLPRNNLNVVVVEVVISGSYDSIEGKKIFDRPLCDR